MQRSLEARGDICLFRWIKGLSHGCVEETLILSSLDVAWFCTGGEDTLRADSAVASCRDFCLPAGAVLLQDCEVLYLPLAAVVHCGIVTAVDFAVLLNGTGTKGDWKERRLILEFELCEQSCC